MLILFISLYELNTIILLVIVFIAYGATLFLTKSFDDEDLKLLTTLINKS